jgi:hypothetical protein
MKVLARIVFSRAVVVDFEPTLLRTFHASQSAKPGWVVGAISVKDSAPRPSGRYALDSILDVSLPLLRA